MGKQFLAVSSVDFILDAALFLRFASSGYEIFFQPSSPYPSQMDVSCVFGIFVDPRHLPPAFPSFLCLDFWAVGFD
jgi:hypothetical protein